MLRERVRDIYSHMPTLETPHLILRKLIRADASDMNEFSRREEVSKYLLWDRHTSMRYTKAYLSDLLRSYRDFTYFEWAVTLKGNGKMIGTCGFTKFHYGSNTGEIGYSLHPDYWGRGYATEAAQATVVFGFSELDLHRIEAYFALENTASRRVLEHCGMIYRGETEPMVIKGVERRIGYATLTREEYDTLAAPVG